MSDELAIDVENGGFDSCQAAARTGAPSRRSRREHMGSNAVARRWEEDQWMRYCVAQPMEYMRLPPGPETRSQLAGHSWMLVGAEGLS